MLSARKLLAVSLCLSAQHTFALSTGDIAFTALNTDEDGWAIVALAELAADSTIYFTDSNWGGAAFSSAEGFHTWSIGAAAISAGSVIRFSQIDQAGRAASIGTLTSSGSRALSSTAETVYAYLGTAANSPTTFLAAVSSEANAAATIALAAAGLQAGVNAVILPASTDFAEYTGPRSGEADFAAYRLLVNAASNWTGFTDGDHASAQPDLAAFSVSVSPVPEVSGGWMMLAGLALVAARLRR
ncbi:putative outer membrane adhesin like protein domain protein [Methyloversatilis sp. RAC08]|uniref:hypothetical protein n=1 Tax=Methyloversatilis sp. RAC08 TaxID=1842540 RepID=UPI00083E446F|nr:hypothetical protein [Methyloversatilis sp. RAC08]AOF80760.1 putative outer membrane adhesin like protein domain protein [Methyloversatilis sp. RAC08]